MGTEGIGVLDWMYYMVLNEKVSSGINKGDRRNASKKSVAQNRESNSNMEIIFRKKEGNGVNESGKKDAWLKMV